MSSSLVARRVGEGETLSSSLTWSTSMGTPCWEGGADSTLSTSAETRLFVGDPALTTLSKLPSSRKMGPPPAWLPRSESSVCCSFI